MGSPREKKKHRDEGEKQVLRFAKEDKLKAKDDNLRVRDDRSKPKVDLSRWGG